MKTNGRTKNKVNVITLGCSKNLVDSEVLMAQLNASNFEVKHQSEKEHQEIVIINTCGFIDKAKEESVQTIMQYAAAKQAGKVEKLYVTGCLSQRYKDQLEIEIPEVDAFFGTLELPALLHQLGANYQHELIGERMLTTAQHFAYLKISEGCNRTCSFCAIPLMRGKHISRSMEDIIIEARKLVAMGVKEIILIAQELTYYGLDLYKSRKLDELLIKLSDVEGLEWIRLHYAYPHKFPLEILAVMKDKKNICNYLDIPLQHAADSVLVNMKRQIIHSDTVKLLNTIREKVPEIAIRTTMLVGFPGETEKDFEDLLYFVEQQKFERLGVFEYSHEDATSAYNFNDDVPQEVKTERAAKLMELQEDISFSYNQKKIGQTLRVLFDRKEGEYFIGRTEFDSPEVDNEVLVHAAKNFVRIGDFANVKITDAHEFDLIGTIVS